MAHQFINYRQAHAIASEWGTPVYVYDQKLLESLADEVLAFPNPFGYTPRYAMKACPTRAILQLFHNKGIHIDASSTWEIERALKAGYTPEMISLSAQELKADELKPWIESGVTINACSFAQLKMIVELGQKNHIGLRWNPGVGSGGTTKTNVGGPSSSFGIWNGYVDEIRAWVDANGVIVEKIHSHIGSGGEVEVWKQAAKLTLNIAESFPTATKVDLGGGFKVARNPDESYADLHDTGQTIHQALIEFKEKTGREIHLEIEPGTYLIANAGALLCSVNDVMDTGKDGYQFIKLDAGMNDILRPTLYGAQQPMHVLQENPPTNESDYVIVGHCCESGDLLSPAPGTNDELFTRRFPEVAIGDYLVIGGAGAYCSGMSAKNYNSFPEVAEVLIDPEGQPKLIRKRQTLDQIVQNELSLA